MCNYFPLVCSKLVTSRDQPRSVKDGVKEGENHSTVSSAGLILIDN